MKCKTMKHGNIGLQCMMLVFILAVCFSSCKDSKDDTSAPYDPNLPVEVTDFTPKSGGGKKKMIIYAITVCSPIFISTVPSKQLSGVEQ